MLHDRITRLGVSVILSVVAYQAAARDIVLMNAPYLNPQLAVEDRVKDLVGRMSPDEKCAQIGLVVGFDAFARVQLEPGETKSVGITVSPEILGRYDRAGRFVPCKGSVDYEVQGPSGELK